MRFQNPPGGPKRNWNLFKWMAFFLRRLFDKAPSLPPDFVIPPGEALRQYEQFKQDDTLTWLGHSTFLIKLQNITILTDPFLTDHAAPFKSWGPKRFTPPGLSIAELPPLDIIIVSHDHFDHLDLKTLTAIPDKERIHIVVPLKMGHSSNPAAIKISMNWTGMPITCFSKSAFVRCLLIIIQNVISSRATVGSGQVLPSACQTKKFILAAIQLMVLFF
ncbi:hypothetical protein AQULUS_02320 [Aquicella lusitana]|uniref:Beta-lactamase family protein n=1 Tax=Aquicella lusitana TaxID=254246 RepID=A0A370GL85_9COXI|nr:beta-lactamase family protein [Aquicella lusitana]VVC72520.1 hypothetical protein AQULUS_02320 [Aquicella lusitana]